MDAADNQWMAQALRLAERGLNTTTPNPRVGCVLVAEGKVLGEGYTQPAGQNHAEVEALAAARARGNDVRGATAYVTLEPCSHFGRTPPCCDALIAAGVTRVVVAMQDPNPQVSGQGNARLRAAGIQVECGLMEETARALNAGFISRMTRGIPKVVSKVGMSLDGRTALANGVSQWITGPDAREDVQRWRARSCAVLTGINTVIADDAQLTVREIACTRQPLRVVLDSRLRMPLNARILHPHSSPASGEGVGGEGGLLIYTALHDGKKTARLVNAGATVVVLPGETGQVDLQAMLRDLARRGCNEVLVEAGAVLNGALLKAGLVDELLLYLAPTLLGDMARGMASLGALASLDQRIDLAWQDVRQIGRDLRIMARVKNNDMKGVENV